MTVWALPEPLKTDFEKNSFNPCVGQVLLSETDNTRVWYMRIAPG